MFVLDRTNIDKALDEIEQEVYERGNKAGLEQGRRQVLAMLLEKKFGQEDSRDERLKSIDASELEIAVSLLLDAEDEDVFWQQFLEQTSG